MAPLGLLIPGERAEVVEIREKKGHCNGRKEKHICHAEDMGIRVGNVIEMLNSNGRGPVLIKIDESRIALGRGMAMKIMVKKLKSGSE